MEENDTINTNLRLLSVTVKEGKKEFTIDLFDREKTDWGNGYSILIGPNGVGKSYLMRGIVDFFIGLERYRKSGKMPDNKRRFEVLSVSYLQNDFKFHLQKNSSGFSCLVNDVVEFRLDTVKIPHIVCANFGYNDRFPLKRNTADVDFYNHVGAKASGNYYSPLNIVIQTMSMLFEGHNTYFSRRLVSVFDKIGYQPTMLVVPKFTKEQKSQALGSFYDFDKSIMNRNLTKNSFSYYTEKRWQNLPQDERKKLYETFREALDWEQFALHYDFDGKLSGYEFGRNFYYLHELKKLGFINKLQYYFFKEGKAISSSQLSSGELNLLATIVSIACAVDDSGTLVLIDEPELSQHPNWQMGFVSQLDEVIKGFNSHVIMATHSHLMVADLPQGRSSVVSLTHDPERGLEGHLLKEDTYGWSPEQVLLEAFQTSTDRNIYLSEKVGALMEKISKNEIGMDDVNQELDFLGKVSQNLRDIDPMKSIINSILKAFEE